MSQSTQGYPFSIIILPYPCSSDTIQHQYIRTHSPTHPSSFQPSMYLVRPSLLPSAPISPTHPSPARARHVSHAPSSSNPPIYRYLVVGEIPHSPPNPTEPVPHMPCHSVLYASKKVSLCNTHHPKKILQSRHDPPPNLNQKHPLLSLSAHSSTRCPAQTRPTRTPSPSPPHPVSPIAPPIAMGIVHKKAV